MVHIDPLHQALTVVAGHPEVFSETAAAHAQKLTGSDECSTPDLRMLQRGLRVRRSLLEAFNQAATPLGVPVALNDEGRFVVEQISSVLGVFSKVLPETPKNAPLGTMRP